MIRSANLGAAAPLGAFGGIAATPLSQLAHDATAMNRLLATDVWRGQAGELRMLQANVPADVALAAQWVLAPLQAG
ncbi:hypothetical protein ABWL39_10265 [Chitinivorax sp. PXF-14]|uniref:hypothetical protein n=1 Tax=Chitinivorax sp. PXF-14 TaxID=3230488 RepID=UPI003466FAAB